MFSSKTDQWATPQDFFDELNLEFHFTLDPCADKDNHKCKKYFTKEDDGLQQDWGGETVFCNPPYGRNLTGQWVKKASEEINKPGTTVVLLLPSRTDTKWFHDYLYKKDNVELRFVKGRLKFGDGKNSAPFGSLIAVMKSE